MASAAVETVEERFEFVPAMARGLAVLEPEDLEAGSLTLPLVLSLWMHRAGTDRRGAVDGLLALRGALVEAGGLDARSEPVPLRTDDEPATVVSLALYVDGLLDRAATASASDRLEVAEEALDVLALDALEADQPDQGRPGA
jgi:hypothetical protein